LPSIDAKQTVGLGLVTVTIAGSAPPINDLYTVYRYILLRYISRDRDNCSTLLGVRQRQTVWCTIQVFSFRSERRFHCVDGRATTCTRNTPPAAPRQTHKRNFHGFTDSHHRRIYHWATWAMPPPPLNCEKNCCYQMSDFKAKMHQIRFRLGLRPRPRWGSLQRSARLPI